MPGDTVHLTMSPDPRIGHRCVDDVEDSCVKAGVLVLFYLRGGKPVLVLTRRTDRVNIHQSQISFPGGRQEKGETFEETALREAEEELGIERDCLQILGRLSPLYIPPTNYCIYPVVAVAERQPDFHPSPLEVAEVIGIPLEHLLSPGNVRREKWTYRGLKIRVPCYIFEGHKIWGATAMVLAELLELATDAFSK